MSSQGTVYFARWVLCDNELIENGAIRVVEGTITHVGHRTGIRQSEDRIVSLGERMLLPGMINLHAPLEESPLRGSITQNLGHTHFVQSKDNLLEKYSTEMIAQRVQLAIGESLANGITTTVSPIHRLNFTHFTDFPGRQWLLEQFSSDDAHSRFELAHRLSAKIKNSEIHGITPDRLYLSSPLWLKEVQRSIQKSKALFSMHLSESADENEAFTENSGYLYELLKIKEQWFYGKSARGPVWAALSNNLIPRGSIVINPCYSGADELSALQSLRTTIAISPRYNKFFGLKQFPLELMRNRHLSLAVVSETPAVAESINLLDELFEIRQHYAKIPAIDLIKMVTLNPAKALKASQRIGTLKQGMDADIIAVDVEQHCSDPLEEIISGNGTVGAVIMRGEELIIPS